MVTQEQRLVSPLAIVNGTLRGILNRENISLWLVDGLWTVVGNVRGILACGLAWWGAAYAPLHCNPLYTHPSPSPFRFPLGTAVIFKTQTSSYSLWGIQQRAEPCLSKQLGVVAFPSPEHHCY